MYIPRVVFFPIPSRLTHVFFTALQFGPLKTGFGPILRTWAPYSLFLRHMPPPQNPRKISDLAQGNFSRDRCISRRISGLRFFNTNQPIPTDRSGKGATMVPYPLAPCGPQFVSPVSPLFADELASYKKYCCRRVVFQLQSQIFLKLFKHNIL